MDHWINHNFSIIVSSPPHSRHFRPCHSPPCHPSAMATPIRLPTSTIQTSRNLEQKACGICVTIPLRPQRVPWMARYATRQAPEAQSLPHRWREPSNGAGPRRSVTTLRCDTSGVQRSRSRFSGVHPVTATRRSHWNSLGLTTIIDYD